MTEVEQVRLQVKRGISQPTFCAVRLLEKPFQAAFLDVPKFSQIFWIKKPEVLIDYILQGNTSGTDKLAENTDASR